MFLNLPRLNRHTFTPFKVRLESEKSKKSDFTQIPIGFPIIIPRSHCQTTPHFISSYSQDVENHSHAEFVEN